MLLFSSLITLNSKGLQYIKYIINIYVCSAFVGLDNKLHKMYGTYIKLNLCTLYNNIFVKVQDLKPLTQQ